MVCPQCGSGAAVHAVQELADIASMQLGQTQPGFPGAPQQSAQRGWEAEPRPIRQGSNNPVSSGDSFGGDSTGSLDGDIGDIAGVVLGVAAKFIGRRLQRAYTERVQPAMAAQREAMLRNQIAIAERHPDLRGCMNDQVIFLAGGNRVLPFPNLMTLTIDQADAMVATLRSE